MNNFLIFLLTISIQLCVIVPALVLINRFTESRYSRRWIQILWILLAVRVMVPVHVQISIPWPAEKLEPAVLTMGKGIQPKEGLTAQNADNVGGTKKIKESTSETKVELVKKPSVYPLGEETHNTALKIDFTKVLFGVWILGVVIYISYHITALLVFQRRLQRESQRVTEEYIMRVLEEQKRLFYRKHPVELRKCATIQSPISLRLWKTQVILPEKEYDSKELEFIFQHEFIHLKYHHIALKYLLCIMNGFYWFHPLVYWMSRKANENLEYLCDERVIKGRSEEDRKSYSMTILSFLREGKQNVLVNQFTGRKKGVKERVVFIMSGKKMKLPFAACVLCVCLIAGSLVGCGNKKSVVENIIPSSTAKENNVKDITNVLFIGDDVNGDTAWPECILVASVNVHTKKITVLNINRNLNIKGRKLGKYSIKQIREILERDLGIHLDYMLESDDTAVKQAVDMLGGVHLNLSNREAEYLNDTNYIEEAKNRNVKEGEQILNGDQFVGYVRVRHVEFRDNKISEEGRNYRQTYAVESLFEQLIKQNQSELAVKVVKTILTGDFSRLKTDCSVMDAVSIMNEILSGGYQMQTYQIPYAQETTEEIVKATHLVSCDMQKAKEKVQELTGTN